MADMIFGVLLFGVPTLSLALFFISLYRYVSAKRKNKRTPDAFSEAEIGARKMMLVIFSVISGVLLSILIGLTVLLCLAVAFM